MTSRKLNPLHKPDWIARMVEATGLYDPSRMTGRSTADALELLARAIRNPNVPQFAQDHTGLSRMSEEVLNTALRIAHQTGLEHLWGVRNGSRSTLTFQRLG